MKLGILWSLNMRDHLMLPAISPIALLRQARALAALLLMLAMACPWACLPRGLSARRKLGGMGWSVLLAGFGIPIRCQGAPSQAGGTLFVANHVSWIDIPVLALLLDAGFVAKAEIGRWPVIGPLARRFGCLFIDRGVRAGVRYQADALDNHLSGSRSIVLFPEGTTSDGKTVRPFRSSLLAAAGQGSWPCVQPVTIRYRRRDGVALDDCRRRGVAWLDEDELLPHAFALAGKGGVLAEVIFEEPVFASDRKELARMCQRAIASRLAEPDSADQAATLKRAA
jgi:1-acyl-sn-glycerol-3-phosphate acyltransferase